MDVNGSTGYHIVEDIIVFLETKQMGLSGKIQPCQVTPWLHLQLIHFHPIKSTKKLP